MTRFCYSNMLLCHKHDNDCLQELWAQEKLKIKHTLLFPKINLHLYGESACIAGCLLSVPRRERQLWISTNTSTKRVQASLHSKRLTLICQLFPWNPLTMGFLLILFRFPLKMDFMPGFMDICWTSIWPLHWVWAVNLIDSVKLIGSE